jgi:hypothetical protein
MPRTLQGLSEGFAPPSGQPVFHYGFRNERILVDEFGAPFEFQVPAQLRKRFLYLYGFISAVAAAAALEAVVELIFASTVVGQIPFNIVKGSSGDFSNAPAVCGMSTNQAGFGNNSLFLQNFAFIPGESSQVVLLPFEVRGEFDTVRFRTLRNISSLSAHVFIGCISTQ